MTFFRNGIRRTTFTNCRNFLSAQSKKLDAPLFVAQILVAAGIFLTEQATPLGVSGGVLYVIPVLLGLLANNRKLIYLGAALGTLLIITGYPLSPQAGEPWEVIVNIINRSLAVFIIWVTAILCLLQNRTSGRAVAIRSELEERVRQRTIELNESNARLTRETNYVQLSKDIAVTANETHTNETHTLEKTLETCLRQICARANWSVGHVYLPASPTSSWLNPTKIWYMKNPQQFAAFRKISEATIMGPGEGLPGRVFASGLPAWIIDVTKDPNFPRAKHAENIGVKAGLAFPILNGQQVAGVMEFFSAQAAEPDQEMMEVMAQVGTQLGRVVERQQAKEAIQDSNERLRKLYHRLELIREEERTRIAREVHDELAQILTTLKLELSLFDKKLLKQHPSLRTDTQMMLELIDNTVQSAKKLATELRPPILDDLGLQEAVEWQGREFEKRTGIRFHFDNGDEGIVLDTKRSTTVFRIFQETLTNILRHARAKNIDATMSENDDTITLQVCDDGIGIKPEQVSNVKSLGLLGMRERALVWGGKVAIESADDQGTTVTIEIQRD